MHPLEEYNDDLVYEKFKFHRQFIFDLAEELREDIEFDLLRKRVTHTRSANVFGFAILRNWMLSKHSGRSDRC